MLGFVTHVSYDRQTCLVDIRVGIRCCTVFLNEMMKSLFCLIVHCRYKIPTRNNHLVPMRTSNLSHVPGFLFT
jgi:hypothetical protein